MPDSYPVGTHRSQGLVDVLDRILDKGLVIAGDIRIHLANVELLTIQIRLLVCSVDKADEIGLDWWRSDPFLSSRAAGEVPRLDAIGDQLAVIEKRIGSLERQKQEQEPSTQE